LTLEQCAMKSERQLLRNALCCAWVGCAAAPSMDIRKLAANRESAVDRPTLTFNAMTLTLVPVRSRRSLTRRRAPFDNDKVARFETEPEFWAFSALGRF
jgi:hypothetical protein